METPGPGASVIRTDLAEDRTILATERTFASWLRTSLGCIALAIGLHALFGSMRPTWAPRAIASGFLLLAVLIAWLAVARASAVTQRLSAHMIPAARVANLKGIAAIVSLGAFALVAAIWLLRIG